MAQSTPGIQDVIDEVRALGQKVDAFQEDLNRADERFSFYQTVSQNVVNLAFGLIATAAIAIILKYFSI
jgi:prefoldin subunit 5